MGFVSRLLGGAAGDLSNLRGIAGNALPQGALKGIDSAAAGIRGVLGVPSNTRAAWRGVKGAATGSLVGGTIGGVSAYSNNPYQSTNLKMKNALRGAIVGAAGGAAIGGAAGGIWNKGTLAGLKGIDNLAERGVMGMLGKNLASVEGRAMRGVNFAEALVGGTAKVAGGVASAALGTMARAPKTMMGLAGAGAGVYYGAGPLLETQRQKSPTRTDSTGDLEGTELVMRASQEAGAAELVNQQYGSPQGNVSSGRARALASSTGGLVQGLHRGRHG